MKMNKYIDHTCLRADAEQEDIEQLCKEAREFDFASVCVNPSNIERCKKHLEGTDIAVCTVIGFPLGAMTTEAKVMEAKDAIERGADELDMVVNIGWVKDGYDNEVIDEIRAVKAVAGERIVKVILETCLLTDREISRACMDAKVAGADFVKTSTGFSKGGATVEVVRLIRETVGDRLKIKASGGIRTAEDAKKMIEAGTDRIGTSSGPAICA